MIFVYSVRSVRASGIALDEVFDSKFWEWSMDTYGPVQGRCEVTSGRGTWEQNRVRQDLQEQM
jgi:hypothetical protein